MNVYLSTIFIVCILAIIDAKNNKQENWSFLRLLILVVLVCVAGLRFKVGTDYGAYAGGFPIYFADKINVNFSGLMNEPGIRVLAKIVGTLYFDYGLFIFVCSLITVGFYVITLSKSSEKFWISILLFIFIGSWTVSFNAVRQCLAAAIIFAGHRYIIERQLVRWAFVVLLAMAFHTSAMCCFLLYFVPNRQLKGTGLLFLILVSILGSYYSNFFISVSEFVKNEQINESGMTYATNSVNLIRILVAWIPILIYRLFYQSNISEKNFFFYINLTLINAVLASVTKDSALLFRMGIYTQIFLTISWPMIINRFPASRKIFYSTMLLLVYFIWFTYETDLSTNFDWIFNRPNTFY